MKKVAVAMALVGFIAVWCGSSGADTGLENRLWMAAAIIGVLLMVLGRLVYQHAEYLEQERAKKSIRYRRYLELQEKMGT